MNKTVFLTDLRKLLTYMTDEERDNTIRSYEELFAEAGPEQEESLLRSFGSPTRVAVTIFREYGKGNGSFVPPVPQPQEKPAAVTETAEETPAAEAAEEPAEITVEAPAEERPPETVAEKAARIAAGIEAENMCPEEEPAPSPEEEQAKEAKLEQLERAFVEVPVPPRTPPQAESPYVDEELTEYRIPGWAVTLIMVLTCWLWIPVTVVLWVVVLVAFVVPFALGLGLVAGAAYLVICGIWAMGMVANALLLFGAAAVLLAIGIVLLWLSIWAVIRLSGLLAKGMRGTYRGIFCRRGGKERTK